MGIRSLFAARPWRSRKTARFWYVPEAKGGRDWFRDIREAGDDTEITCSIYDLSAELYGASPWQWRRRHGDCDP